MRKNIIFFLLMLCTTMSYGQFIQLGQSITGNNIYDHFGASISLNETGDIMAVGSLSSISSVNSKAGYVIIYAFDGQDWNQLGDTIKGEYELDHCGSSVDLNADGNIVAIGAHSNHNSTNSGHARVFQYIGSNWVQLGEDIDGVNQYDYFGNRVSLNASGNILGVAAINGISDVNIHAGYVKVYTYDGSSWNQVGSTLEGEHENENFGSSIGLNAEGNILAIGAEKRKIAGTIKGRVKVYSLEGTNWVQIGDDINGIGENGGFGTDLDFNDSGNRLAISSMTFNNDSINACGKVNVFDYEGSTWVQVGSDLLGEYEEDNFGSSVRLNGQGDHIIVGISNYHSSGDSDVTGGAKMYQFSNDDWIQVGQTIIGDDIDDGMGFSVAINSSGSTFAVGDVKHELQNGQVKVFASEPFGLETALGDISIHPNPTQGYISISSTLDVNISEIEIINIMGQQVFSQMNKNTKEKISIDLSQMPNGIYLANVYFENGKHYKAKIVLSK